MIGWKAICGYKVATKLAQGSRCLGITAITLQNVNKQFFAELKLSHIQSTHKHLFSLSLPDWTYWKFAGTYEQRLSDIPLIFYVGVLL